MPLLNFSFLKLIIALVICVVPGVIGAYFIVTSEESKRAMRNKVCSLLFGVSNVIEYPKFARFLTISGVLLLLFTAVSTWFLVVRPMLVD